jgi:hypothetical protein
MPYKEIEQHKTLCEIENTVAKTSHLSHEAHRKGDLPNSNKTT